MCPHHRQIAVLALDKLCVEGEGGMAEFGALIGEYEV